MAATGEQVPAAPVSAQDIQVLVQALPQQTPWAQMVLPDSRVENVSRHRPWEAMPSEHALQSETGVLESKQHSFRVGAS